MPNQRECNAIKSASRTRANTASTTSTSSNTKSNQSSNQSHQRYAIRLAFDGTTYNGFQSQPNSNTIQDQIEHRLSGVLNRNIRVVAWGRTDAGVHARGAVVTVDLNMDEVRMLAKRVAKKKKKKNSKKSSPSSVEVEEEEGDAQAKQIITDAARFLRSVRYVCNSGIDATTTTTSNNTDKNNSNSREGSITSISVTPVPIHFDARYSAVWKRYVYYICDNCDTQTNLPFAWDRYSWQIKQSLDLDRMVDAAALLSCGGGCYRALGEEECGNDERKQKQQQQQQQHNFEWLCVMQPGELRDPRRTVRLSVEVLSRSTVENEEEEDNVPYFLQKNGRSVVYKITGVCDFFLYKMMRRIVGTIVAIGKHDADLDDLKKCIDAYDNYDDDDDDDPRKGTTKIPAKLLLTAPAKGLCLDHIEYGIAI